MVRSVRPIVAVVFSAGAPAARDRLVFGSSAVGAVVANGTAGTFGTGAASRASAMSRAGCGQQPFGVHQRGRAGTLTVATGETGEPTTLIELRVAG
ncbi:hypothetical protein [Streptomyces sp. NPDC058280]|uniref:hypothetical protein n=1 Tax=Streptomyces sp. NPDC058280 TaxID=3346419 RepID=UPI0036E58A58